MSTYRERLRFPLSWAAGALVIVLLAAAELDTGNRGALLPYVLLPLLVVVGAVAASRQEVRVADGVLHVHGARAPVVVFGPAEVLDRDQLRRWLGPQADPYAWVAVRPWVRTGVRLPVLDPADDTPYWLVGTRDPVALAAALS